MPLAKSISSSHKQALNKRNENWLLCPSSPLKFAFASAVSILQQSKYLYANDSCYNLWPAWQYTQHTHNIAMAAISK